MNQSTKGPWKLDIRNNTCYGVTAEEGTCTIFNHGSKSYSDYVAQAAHGHGHELGSQAHANMNLISHTPTMLDLLKRLDHAWNLNIYDWDSRNYQLLMSEVKNLLSQIESG